LNFESAVIVPKAHVYYNIVGEAVMLKQRLLDETPTNPLTGETFMFSTVSKEGREKTTHLLGNFIL
jgi:hypothetical protein